MKDDLIFVDYPELRQACRELRSAEFGRDWDLFVEAEYLGVAKDEDENGNVVDLPTFWQVGMRLFKTLWADSDGRWRAFAGIDNATNDVVLPQLGLPQPGRTLSFGVVFEAT